MRPLFLASARAYAVASPVIPPTMTTCGGVLIWSSDRGRVCEQRRDDLGEGEDHIVGVIR